MSHGTGASLPLVLTVLLPWTPAQEVRPVDSAAFIAATHDIARGRTVAVNKRGAVVEWDGAVWRQRAATGIEGIPGAFQLCFDPNGRRSLLAGVDVYGVFHTRAFDGVEWTDLQPASRPTARWAFSMAFDSNRNELLMFGGYNVGPLAETWIYDGVDWSLQTPTTSPSARTDAALAHDLARRRTVLFGGVDTTRLADTWEWDGTQWRQIATATSPPVSGAPAMTYDIGRGGMVLAAESPTFLTSMWAYDGNDWQSLPAAGPTPEHGYRPNLVHELARDEYLLLGGLTWLGGYRRDVWALDLTTGWAPRTGIDGPLIRASEVSISLSNPTGEGLVLLESQPPTQFITWLWDGSWRLGPGGAPPWRQNAAATTGPGLAYVYGGADANGAPLDDLWGFDGTSWSQLPAQGPIAGGGTSIAYDTLRGELVLFGGRSGTTSLAQTWVFDGATWQQRFPANSPPGRQHALMEFDYSLGKVVLFGGYDGLWYQDTWTWDGTDWTRVPTPGQPPMDSTTMMTFDAERFETVAVTSSTNGTARYWYFDGARWGLFSATPQVLGHLLATAVGWPYQHGTLISSPEDLLVLSSSPPGSAHYGQACTGSAPDLAANEWPRLGSANFGIDIVRAPANALVAFVGATGAANVNLGNCTLLVQPGQAGLLLSTSPNGFASAPLPLPNAATLDGVDLYFQAAALEPTAPGGFTLSRGLRVRLGY